MSAYATITKVVAYSLISLWAIVAFALGWPYLWRRRQSLNAHMGTAYAQFGEEFHPVGRLKWMWIVVRSVPMLLLLAFIGMVLFLLHIVPAIYSLVTGKPPPMADPIDFDDSNEA